MRFSELFEHQKTGVQFLDEKKRAILADEMGLGKSLQAIFAAEGKTLIVCPASLKINWYREIISAFRMAPVVIIDSKSDDIPEAGWYIINYDILEKQSERLEELIKSKDIRTLILDEAHYIKGKSVRATVIVGGKVKKKDGKVVKFDGLANMIPRTYCLTGTPLLNRPIELFNLLTAIGHPLGGYGKRSVFAKRFCGAFLRPIWVRGRQIYILDETGSSNLDELREHLKGWILRRKKIEVIDLPEKIVSVMACEMSPETKKEYAGAWEAYVQFLKENPLPEVNIDNILMARHLVEIQKLKQVCSRSKVERIVSDIRAAIEQEQKVIVFSQYTKTVDMIAEALRASGRGIDPVQTVTLTGADDMALRQTAVDLFQNNPSVKVFIGNIKAAGVGLTLTAGSIVMFADMDWSPEIHKQAEDRAHRIGQGSMVNVYYYVLMDTIEEDIVRILNEKKGVMDQVLEGGKKRISSGGSMQESFLKLVSAKTKENKAVDNSGVASLL